MKTRILYIGMAALLMLSSCHKKEKTAGEEVPEIYVAEAITDSLVLHKTYPGYLNADSKAVVVAQVDGRLLSKHFEPGGYVKKGQLL